MSYTAGGVTFSTPAGNFATIGSKTLTLSATGTPTAAGVNNLTASPSTLCAASYTANPATAVFTCSSATVNGTYTVGTAVSASNTITLILNVTQAGNYPAMSYTAGGVTFSTPTGNFATIGSKTLTLSATGTPTTAGVNNLTANPSTLCTASYTATAPGTAALNCANASYKSGNVLVAGTNSTNLIYNLPYTAGNGGSYNQYTVASAGVTGLTATIDAGSFANGAGNLDVKITGTPNTSGNATFTIAFGGSNCSFTVPVLTNSTSFTSCIESSTFGRNVSTSGNTNFTFPGSKTVGINATPSGGLSGGSFCNPQQWFGDFYTGYCGVNMGSTANMRIGTSAIATGSLCNNKKVVFRFTKPVNDITVHSTWYYWAGLGLLEGNDNMSIYVNKGTISASVSTSCPEQFNVDSSNNKITVSGTASTANLNGILLRIRSTEPFTEITLENNGGGDDVIATLSYCNAVVY